MDIATPCNEERTVKPLRKRSSNVNIRKSLVVLCREVIVADLERFPPESFGICDEKEWTAIVELRHRKSRPKEGSGGLDGTGRMVPAVSDKFLEAVEECNSHLADCVATDHMLWRDCVEYRFRRGGLTRPDSLLYPWPIQVENLKSAAQALLLKDTDVGQCEVETVISNAISYLTKSPMNVPLLRDSGVGKILKKVLKSPHPAINADVLLQLQNLVESWMSLAANAGIEVKHRPNEATMDDSLTKEEESRDLAIAETCTSWRKLFAALKIRADERRNSQGKRMREIRRNLAATRPKLVKVRPTVAKHDKILGRSRETLSSGWSSSQSNHSSGKVSQIRKEVMSQSKKLKPSGNQTNGSFANAVAFASCSTKGKAHRTKTTSIVHVSGNKRMTIPTQVVKGAGLRQLASKWKR